MFGKLSVSDFGFIDDKYLLLANMFNADPSIFDMLFLWVSLAPSKGGTKSNEVELCSVDEEWYRDIYCS